MKCLTLSRFVLVWLVVLIALNVLLQAQAFAQISSAYNFRVSSGGTVLVTPPGSNETSGVLVRGRTTAPFYTNAFYPDVPIGFSFPFNGISYTSLNVFEAGYVSFNGIPRFGSNPAQFRALSASGAAGVISAFAYFLSPLTGEGVLFYRNSGTAPNRTFTVQWRRFYNNSNGGDGTSTQAQQMRIDFELSLSENGTITIRYGSVDFGSDFGGSAGTTPILPEVGIGGGTAGNSLSLTNNISIPPQGRLIAVAWSSAITWQNNPLEMILSRANTTTHPTGTTFTFTPTSLSPPAPTITGFTPTSGVVGASVVITGTNFTGATAVRFGGVSAVFTVNSATQITATVPVGAVSGGMSIVTPSGTATSATNFTVTVPPPPPTPTITSFTPTSGVVGASVVITGTNFTGATAVRFGGVLAGFMVNSATQITAMVPVGARTGFIQVETSGGVATSLAPFTVGIAAILTSFTPISGGIGTEVTITGTGLQLVREVFFGSFGAAFRVNSDGTQITTTAPEQVTTASIILRTISGTRISSSMPFTYVPGAPVIARFTPNPASLLSTLTISGSGFTGATNVLMPSYIFPSGISVAPTVVNDRTITLTIPINTLSGIVTVQTPRGNASSLFDFTTRLDVNIRNFTPNSGAVGTMVTIIGSGLASATSVSFGSVAAMIVSQSDGQIQVRVPAGASGRVPIIVQTPSGVGTPPYNLFTISAVPSIASFAPATGAVGASVTLTGTNFTGATAVSFGSTPAASFTVVSGEQIRAVVPAGASAGVISVVTPSGTATSVSPFTPIATPRITALTPASGSVGSSFTITGVALTGASRVLLGSTAITAFTVLSDGSISATVPAGAASGTVQVVTSGGTATSAVSFNVVPPTPTITSFAPMSALPGATVTLTGTNFTGATAVSFGTLAAASFVVVSATQITSVVPSGVSIGELRVVTPLGTATSGGRFSPLLPPPTITSISPTSGSPGTSITITGMNLSGITSVRFGGEVVASFTPSADGTTLSAVVGVGATGDVSVVSPRGTATLPSAFTFVPPVPTITSISPTSALFI